VNRILHLGCGRKRYDAAALLDSVGLQAPEAHGAEVLHLDADARLDPDLVCHLGEDAIPLPDDSVDLVIAWHVLEHIGAQTHQGAAQWFQFWEELYRVLTPAGWLYAESPYYTSIWAWSDPTHVRALSEHCFVFMCQDSYRIPESMISPYRLRCDFHWLGLPGGMERGWGLVADPQEPKHTAIRFALQARKPFRGWWED
jgi:SAM-dependent methyltransferase